MSFKDHTVQTVYLSSGCHYIIAFSASANSGIVLVYANMDIYALGSINHATVHHPPILHIIHTALHR